MSIDDEGSTPSGTQPDEVVVPATVAKPPKGDPVVQALTVTILIIVALTLVTVIYAIVGGVFGSGSPKTMGENKLMNTAAAIKAGNKDPQVWVAYISALIGDRQYQLAQETIERGKKTLAKQDVNQDMVYMQATLDEAQGNNDKALATAELAIKAIKKANEEAKVNYKKTGNPTESMILEDNASYWDLLLLKAALLEKKSEWKKALAVYDEYLSVKETAATVFTQRGNVKEKLGDKKGAEADYRQTLVFISDNKDALAGLKRIGVAK